MREIRSVCQNDHVSSRANKVPAIGAFKAAEIPMAEPPVAKSYSSREGMRTTMMTPTWDIGPSGPAITPEDVTRAIPIRWPKRVRRERKPGRRLPFKNDLMSEKLLQRIQERPDGDKFGNETTHECVADID